MQMLQCLSTPGAGLLSPGAPASSPSFGEQRAAHRPPAARSLSCQWRAGAPRCWIWSRVILGHGRIAI